MEQGNDGFECVGVDLTDALALAGLVAPVPRSLRLTEPCGLVLKAVPAGLVMRAAFEGSSVEVRLPAGFSRGQMVIHQPSLEQVAGALVLEAPGGGEPSPVRSIRPLTLTRRSDGGIEAAVADRRAPVLALDDAAAAPEVPNAQLVASVSREPLEEALTLALAASEASGERPGLVVRLEVIADGVRVVGGDSLRRLIAVVSAITTEDAGGAVVLPARRLRDVVSALRGPSVGIGFLEQVAGPPRLVLVCGDARVVLRTARGDALAPASMPEAGGCGWVFVDREPLLVEVRRARMVTEASDVARPEVELSVEAGGVRVRPLLRRAVGEATSGWVGAARVDDAAVGARRRYDGHLLASVLGAASGERVVLDVGRPGASTAVEDAGGGWNGRFAVRQLIRCGAVGGR